MVARKGLWLVKRNHETEREGDTEMSPCPKLYLEGTRICLWVSEKAGLDYFWVRIKSKLRECGTNVHAVLKAHLQGSRCMEHCVLGTLLQTSFYEKLCNVEEVLLPLLFDNNCFPLYSQRFLSSSSHWTQGTKVACLLSISRTRIGTTSRAETMS